MGVPISVIKMDEKEKANIITELNVRMLRLPIWQKKTTLEIIKILKSEAEPTKKEMYINLRTAGHFDLADKFKPKEKRKEKDESTKCR